MLTLSVFSGRRVAQRVHFFFVTLTPCPACSPVFPVLTSRLNCPSSPGNHAIDLQFPTFLISKMTSMDALKAAGTIVVADTGDFKCKVPLPSSAHPCPILRPSLFPLLSDTPFT